MGASQGSQRMSGSRQGSRQAGSTILSLGSTPLRIMYQGLQMRAAIVGHAKNSTQARLVFLPAFSPTAKCIRGSGWHQTTIHPPWLSCPKLCLTLTFLFLSLPVNGSTSTRSLPASLLSPYHPRSSMTPVRTSFLCLSHLFHLHIPLTLLVQAGLLLLPPPTLRVLHKPPAPC